MSHRESVVANLVAPLLRLPPSPPEPPPGDRGTARVFRAADAWLAYRYLGLGAGSLSFLLPAAAGLIGTAVTRQWAAFAVVAAVSVAGLAQLVLTFAALRLDWELRYYVMTDRSLRIREGAWTVREMTLTFLNVQNVSIAQGPIERLFGISNVVLQTAGGGASPAQRGQSASGHLASLRGVSNPEEVRDLIRARMEAARRDAGLGDLEDAAAEAHAGLAAHAALLREIRSETRALAAAASRAG